MTLRDWATPLVIGASLLMAVTGLLIFFDLNTGFVRGVHEWGGWALVAGIISHGLANKKALLRYVQTNGRARAIIALFIIVLFASLWPTQNKGAAPAPILALRALADAPISSVAALSGQSTEAALAKLAAAGITLSDGTASLNSALGNNREQVGKALAVLLASQR